MSWLSGIQASVEWSLCLYSSGLDFKDLAQCSTYSKSSGSDDWIDEWMTMLARHLISLSWLSLNRNNTTIAKNSCCFQIPAVSSIALAKNLVQVFCLSVVPDLYGTRNRLRGRQFFQGLGSGGMVSGCFKHVTFWGHFLSNLTLWLIWQEAPVCGPEVGDLYKMIWRNLTYLFGQPNISNSTAHPSCVEAGSCGSGDADQRAGTVPKLAWPIEKYRFSGYGSAQMSMCSKQFQSIRLDQCVVSEG